ncbi:MAG: 1-acyl-sn-glycerol-3-phosphate acyltransferase [Acidaminococcaceae bacterium]|jgi:1-acyl-sn-glycerol-3-phosphate acyltransferase|nr:1-acyl-sn-glycerol-3-phosphate acyltransferase [Acidaminococcaceae bacterium]MBO5636409.1 1-acyl-sn-glycerol-3-phosphate acyltransferase [Acidaminococcaceae bacterium]MBR1661399.1 1-acyl-sn-glycerol-3-phosphate acyltransferase [Acidaminococcaceae bacterium]HAT98041.1 1-acyl-sn-glycerol-3-phosphate acyltransferase [Acidaminococcaceae bacterium]
MSLYDFCHITFPWLFSLWLRWEVFGRENIPADGPVVIACNHLSLLDPPVLGAAATRQVHFMAKSELFRPSWFGAIIRKLGAFPVRRGAMDRDAIKTGLTILKEKKVLAVFPEGTRSKTGELGRAGGGAFMMAVKMKAKIVPAYIYGTDLKRHPGWPKVRVIFGKPMEYDPAMGTGRESLDEIGARWREEVLTLKKAVTLEDGNYRS